MPTASKLPVDSDATAAEMAEAMFGSGISILSASYAGASSASGIYSNGDVVAPDLTPSDTGVILSTGVASDVTNTSGDVNTSASTSTDHGLAGDSDLSAISGQTTYDAAVFEADFVPEGSTLTMQIVFSSEEYLEYVDSGFNDAVGVWVNGAKAKLMVGSGDISIDNINTTTNENLYIDNAQSVDTYNTEMDGFTVTLTLKAPVTPGVTNSIKIGIADGGDGTYDSNLLIAGESVQTALVAVDDTVTLKMGQTESVDLLANDQSLSDSELTITHINGVPVTIGETVTLPSGEDIELTSSGFIMASSSDSVEDNVFSYTVEDAEGRTDVGFVTIDTIPCFAAGTLIDTPIGARPVEMLRPGDLVETLDHGPQPLLWRGVSKRSGVGREAPILIKAGRLGALRDTLVSPQHRLLLQGPMLSLIVDSNEVFARAKDLVDSDTVRQQDVQGGVLLVHLLFDRHHIIRGDGVLSESYCPGEQTIGSFSEQSKRDLARVMRRSGLGSMPAARSTLRSHEVRTMLPAEMNGCTPFPGAAGWSGCSEASSAAALDVAALSL